MPNSAWLPGSEYPGLGLWTVISVAIAQSPFTANSLVP